MNKGLDLYLNTTGVIRGLISCPFRMLAMTIGIPNFKIVYKSGHVERIFLKRISKQGGDWEWESVTGTSKGIVILGVDDIVSVIQLY